MNENWTSKNPPPELSDNDAELLSAYIDNMLDATEVAALEARLASDAFLRSELAAMRVRIKQMREALRDKLAAAGMAQDFSFITRQRGMFSYSGLTKDQMVRLRNEFGIYGVDSGRICVAALNDRNIDAVVQAIGRVL